MAVKHNWLSDEILHTQYLGTVDGAELIKAAHEIGSDHRMEKVRFIIGDWTDIENADISPEDIRELAAYIYALSKSYPLVWNASVVPDNESGLARASLFDVLIEGLVWKTDTFYQLEDAFQWYKKGIETELQKKAP
ncbi:hypothetical protein FLL45_14090 [Aliikangiella marina]|uniref:STAS/SEC14 domain-containing protein n=1 Tax=Aliikangiella marina TaxID=1712262 RepID=A0A545T9V4_9GAMM|nr:hypothetical protein [Aliikangiella marina]TQV73987.1 hypothetical protein FLL45_14090 [Aliikangiella marina]